MGVEVHLKWRAPKWGIPGIRVTEMKKNGLVSQILEKTFGSVSCNVSLEINLNKLDICN